ncbi:MAG: hypothetical protein Q4C47_01335 [Planctomycetia bacterium]|nr:hypothetical protein [Planctomycetia bacterium]
MVVGSPGGNYGEGHIVKSEDTTHRRNVRTSAPSGTGAGTGVESVTDSSVDLSVDLRNRWLAAILAWMLPGLGHLYQRRTAKGILFLLSILGLFWFGCGLGSDPRIGGARCVSVPMAAGESRLAIYCQSLTGLSAMPAWYQAGRVEDGLPPRWNGFMAPTQPDPDQVPRPDADANIERLHRQRELIRSALVDQPTTSRVGFVLRSRYEFGFLCTLTAGLLNLLAILDAFGGPVFPKEEERSKNKEKKEKEGNKREE